MVLGVGGGCVGEVGVGLGRGLAHFGEGFPLPNLENFSLKFCFI